MKNLIEVVRNMASQLDIWASESRTGGWSTHQVDPMIKKAHDLRVEVNVAEKRLPKWVSDPPSNGHYHIHFRPWVTDNGPKALSAEYATDVVYAEIDPDTSEVFLCSAKLGPVELEMSEVGDYILFSGPIKSPISPLEEN